MLPAIKMSADFFNYIYLLLLLQIPYILHRRREGKHPSSDKNILWFPPLSPLIILRDIFFETRNPVACHSATILLALINIRMPCRSQHFYSLYTVILYFMKLTYWGVAFFKESKKKVKQNSWVSPQRQLL